MWLILRRHLQQLVEEIARGYAWISLLPSWKAGVLFAGLTFISPALGAIGLLGAISAWYAGQLAGAVEAERPVCVFNGLLVGLYVAHVWRFGSSVIALTLLGGVLSGWLTVVLGRLTWSSVQLPILSVPFALVAMLTMAAAPSLSTLQMNAYTAPPAVFGGALGDAADKLLGAFGNIFFLSNPYAGLFVVAVIALFSRYYLLLALLGYTAAYSWLKLLGAAPEHLAATAWDSNAILATLLVGGLFATPSLLTACLAVLAAVMAAWLALALGRIVDVAHLLPFSLPFVLAAWLVLYAAVRNAAMSNQFNLLQPDFPERSHARARIGRTRIGEPGSVPLALPYMGSWTVSQGFSGAHTHRGPWRHALDFIVVKTGKSFSGKGNRLDDFYCYGLPVLSPAYGQVWRVVNDVPDNTPGTVNVAAHWGNYIAIRLQDGKFVLLAHLKPGSVCVAPGAWVKPGDLLGHCGNSGRSPQPHIHLHVQGSDDPRAPTVPFHLASVLVAAHESAESHYELSTVPRESSTLTAVMPGDVRPLYLMAGRGLRYTLACNETLRTDWTLRCEVDTQGRLALVSANNARCIAESTWAIFSCYERNEVKDIYLDLWLLACGYTPTSLHVLHWQDRSTPAQMLPNVTAKVIASLGWPWAAFAKSEYTRRWDDDMQAWRQTGTHRQNISGITVTTEALIVPQLGCTYISAQIGETRYTLQATSTFQVADVGIPGWEAPLALSRAPVSGW